MAQTFEQHMEARQLRRMRAEGRYVEKLERLEQLALPLIGELCREGKTVYYINIKDRNGRYTGKTKESSREYELVSYLIRNGYVTLH